MHLGALKSIFSLRYSCVQIGKTGLESPFYLGSSLGFQFARLSVIVLAPNFRKSHTQPNQEACFTSHNKESLLMPRDENKSRV